MPNSFQVTQFHMDPSLQDKFNHTFKQICVRPIWALRLSLQKKIILWDWLLNQLRVSNCEIVG